MNLETIAKEATINTMSMFGLEPIYIETVQQNALSSGSDCNVIIGITEGIKGNAMIGMDRNTAKKLASIMMGGMEILEIDDITISAVAELTNMIIGNIFNNLSSEKFINFSPPTIVVGENLKLMISRVETQKLHFQFQGNSIYIMLCIE